MKTSIAIVILILITALSACSRDPEDNRPYVDSRNPYQYAPHGLTIVKVRLSIKILKIMLPVSFLKICYSNCKKGSSKIFQGFKLYSDGKFSKAILLSSRKR